jgi:hypothetical protein
MPEPKRALLVTPVTESIRDAVDRCAAAHWTSRAEIVRQAVVRDLATKGFSPTPREEELA